MIPGTRVQYTDPEIIDDGFQAVRRGDWVRIIGTTDDPFWFDIECERTGYKQTCHVSELGLPS
jgi:hypothetical protein